MGNRYYYYRGEGQAEEEHEITHALKPVCRGCQQQGAPKAPEFLNRIFAEEVKRRRVSKIANMIGSASFLGVKDIRTTTSLS